ncbi:MAG: DUF2007 domain-containing protein [Flavobacteriales bacterium]|nr:DUF2007 domain-containing protein [Flavobacteriales bacterium]
MSNLVQVYTTDKEYQAQLLTDKLRENGIEPFRLNKRDSMYPIGYIEIQVASEDVEKARTLIEESGL